MSKTAWLRNSIFGDRDIITSERYFVTIFLFTLVVLAFVRCVFHLISGLSPNTAILAGSTCFLFVGLYYSVRFHSWLLVPKTILSIAGFIFLDLAWYFQSLSKGPILFLILIFAALVVWVWKGKYLLLFMLFYLLNLTILFYIDYGAPDYLFNYPNHKVRSVHVFVSFIFYAFVLVFLLYFIKNEFLRQQKKAIYSDKLKSAFLANMSHEIRTPMNGILGFSDLLRNPDLTGKMQQQYIEIIEKSGHRMLGIINDIIDISKIEAGLVTLEITDSNINDQLEYIHKFFSPEVEAKGMKLTYRNLHALEQINIKTDREKVFAIFINLVKNAIKYSKRGTIEFGYTVEGDFIKFYVVDTGIGIAKNRQLAIFERFVQADIDNLNAEQGAGLGLSITKSYIELLGGKIWLESEIGVGSKFSFTLPFNSTSKDQKIEQQDTLLPKGEVMHQALKILIAEDDEVSETLMSININNFCKAPLVARTGLEAVDICRNNPDLDLVLMDIQLPIYNGYEATKKIREFNKDIIIIAQTAYGLSRDKEMAIMVGCNDFIAKPIGKLKLTKLIEKYFV